VPTLVDTDIKYFLKPITSYSIQHFVFATIKVHLYLFTPTQYLSMRISQCIYDKR